MKNFIIGALVVALIAILAWTFLDKKETVNEIASTPYAAPTVSPTSTAIPSPESMGTTGSVTGKLCFPSEGIPKGIIEAKNIQTEQYVSQDYPGTANGGKSTYTLELPQGTYVFRFITKTDNNPGISGFHTDVCSTGLEPTCAQSNKRNLVKINVVPGQVINGVDLCDFYYDPNNPPTF